MCFFEFFSCSVQRKNKNQVHYYKKYENAKVILITRIHSIVDTQLKIKKWKLVCERRRNVVKPTIAYKPYIHVNGDTLQFLSLTLSHSLSLSLSLSLTLTLSFFLSLSLFLSNLMYRDSISLNRKCGSLQPGKWPGR